MKKIRDLSHQQMKKSTLDVVQYAGPTQFVTACDETRPSRGRHSVSAWLYLECLFVYSRGRGGGGGGSRGGFGGK